MEAFDVGILGGGPAGVALAAALAQDGARVAVFERTAYGQPRWGETVGPEARPMLERLGAWEGFLATRPIPCQAVYSAWGGEELIGQPSLLHPLGEGWHVDRSAVDAMLAEGAERAGASVRRGCGYCRVSRQGQDWTIAPAEGEAARTRLLVDASGRGAPATAGQLRGRRWERFDQLVAVSAVLRHRFPPDGETALTIEAVEHGWWYAAPLPGNRLVVTYLTDADLLAAGRAEATATFWRDELADTRHIAPIVVQTDGFDGKPGVRTVRAESGMGVANVEGFLAAGDAAFARDPLSGSGFLHALQAAERAAGLIRSGVSGDEPAVDPKPYLAERARYYGMEQRWPESAFWKRRIDGD